MTRGGRDRTDVIALENRHDQKARTPARVSEWKPPNGPSDGSQEADKDREHRRLRVEDVVPGEQPQRRGDREQGVARMRAHPQALGVQKAERVSRLLQEDDAESHQPERTEQPADDDVGQWTGRRAPPPPPPPPRGGAGAGARGAQNTSTRRAGAD